MKRILPVFFFLLFNCSYSYSQYARGQMKEDFYEAEMFILYEEYEDALQLFQGLAKIDPRNSNYKYRIGQCLINIPGRKTEAIPFLEAATKEINPRYREGKFRESKAPYDSYYYLANAYRINNQLGKALDYYELFKRNLNTKIYDSTIVNQQIESCMNAMELMKVPIYVKKENLGDIINEQYADFNPVVSADQNVIVYSRQAPFQDALLYSRKAGGKWTAPVNIIPDLGLGQEEGNHPTSLSAAGDELYIYRRGNDFDGNIFVTRKTSQDRWSNLIRLNENINTKYWESHASISGDGKMLYFTSNRKDSYGGLDIYVSRRDSADAWGPAKNLGPVINTKYNEESPFLGKNDKTLYFSSEGHFNIGGYDIFYSVLLENGQWSVPLNLGFPLNTTDDNKFFNPVNDGYKAYYAMIDSSGYGLSDIYLIEIFNEDHPRKFFVRGIVQVKDILRLFGDSIRITAQNLDDPEARVIVYSDPETGEYKFEVPQGKYSLTFESKDAEKVISELNLPLTHPDDSIVIPGTTLPRTDFTADLNLGDKQVIRVTRGDTLYIPIQAEPNSLLTVEHWAGDKLIKTENFVISDSAFVYKTVPLIGENRLVFKLTDRFGNTTISELTVNRQKEITTAQVIRPEYSRVIAEKQVNAFADLITEREDEEMKKFILSRDLGKMKFGSVDDIISYLKEEAAKNNIEPSEIDRLALKVAVNENVLTQAAVDLLAQGSEGELRKILEDLDIQEAGIRSWSDLQKYVSEKSAGRITPDELNRIAEDLISGKDPRIAAAREKISAYGSISEKGAELMKAMEAADRKGRAVSGEWLKSMYDEAVKLGISDSELARMFAAITSRPDTDIYKYINDLASVSDEQLAAYLRSLDPGKLRIRTPADLILYLLRNKDKGLFSEESLFNALARLIASEDIPEDIIKSQEVTGKKTGLAVLWILLGAGIALVFFFLYRRRKDKKAEK